jgi:prevent-host-death family protein
VNGEGLSMPQIIKASDSQLDFENLIEQVTLANKPIFISGNNNKTAVLISETMWEKIQERMDAMIADQRIDELKSGKSEVYSLEEVMKKLNLD